MKILVVTSTFPRWHGDADPTFVYELSKRLVDVNTEVHILAPHTRRAQVMEQLDGLTVHRFRYFFERWETLAYSTGMLDKLRANPFNYLLVPFFMVGMTLAVYRLVKKKKYSVVHAHWLIPQGFACALALRVMPVAPALVCTSHGGDLFGLRGRFATRLKAWVVARSCAVTVVSHYMRDVLFTTLTPAVKPKVMPMGVDLSDCFVPIPAIKRDRTELIYVGRLVEKKGVNYLLRAVSLLVKNIPDIHLTIVGDGPLRTDLVSESRILGLESQVTFLGALTQDRLPALYSKAAIAIVPSVVADSGDQEGLGLVTVEAMGCGCAVVASDLPAIRDVVKNNENGLLAVPRNPASLAEKISLLLNDAERLQHYQSVARNSVFAHFDWLWVAKNYRTLLNSAAIPLE